MVVLLESIFISTFIFMELNDGHWESKIAIMKPDYQQNIPNITHHIFGI